MMVQKFLLAGPMTCVLRFTIQRTAQHIIFNFGPIPNNQYDVLNTANSLWLCGGPRGTVGRKFGFRLIIERSSFNLIVPFAFNEGSLPNPVKCRIRKDAQAQN